MKRNETKYMYEIEEYLLVGFFFLRYVSDDLDIILWQIRPRASSFITWVHF